MNEKLNPYYGWGCEHEAGIIERANMREITVYYRSKIDFNDGDANFFYSFYCNFNGHCGGDGNGCLNFYVDYL